MVRWGGASWAASPPQKKGCFGHWRHHPPVLDDACMTETKSVHGGHACALVHDGGFSSGRTFMCFFRLFFKSKKSLNEEK